VLWEVMELADIYSTLEGPRRLILVVHCRELPDLEPLLAEAACSLSSGRLVIARCLDEGRYISTVSPRYLKSRAGRLHLKLLSELKPDITVELHSYSPRAAPALTSPWRRLAPPLVELEAGLLLGSVPPPLASPLRLQGISLLLPRVYLTLEVERGSNRALEAAARVMRQAATCSSGLELIYWLFKLYPRQLAKAARRFSRYYMKAARAARTARLTRL